jgi:pSer/pThr/pTyr-binding forkhead associated (FHA) protein
VIGRSQGTDIGWRTPNVSRRHAEIRREGADYLVVDLGSTNGTEVNGSRVERAKLEPGDAITVGESRLVFSREPS